MKRGMKLYTKVTALSCIVFMCVLVLGIQSAHAASGNPAIRLWDGTGNVTTNSILIVDQGGNDTSLLANVVTYSGTYGAFDVIVSSGVQSGSDILPVLGLNTFEVTSTSGGTLYAWFSNTGFGPAPTPAGFDMSGSISSILGSGTVDFYSYTDNSDTLFGEANLLAHLGPYSSSPTGTGGSTSGSAGSLLNPYSLTTKTVVSLNAGSIMQTTANVAIVPEPVSTTLFIVGGATLGFRRFRKK